VEGSQSTGEAVAVKHSRDAEHYNDKGFRNEVKLLSSVHHRNLVALRGYCLHAKQLLRCMSLWRGGPCGGILSESPGELTWGRRVQYCAGGCPGAGLLALPDCAAHHPPRRQERQHPRHSPLRRQGGRLRYFPDSSLKGNQSVQKSA